MTRWSAAALGVPAWFAVAAFGAVERWSQAIVEVWLFGLAAVWVARRPWRITAAPLLFGLAAAWGAVQVVTGLTVYRAASLAWCVNWLAYAAAAWVAAQVLTEQRALLVTGATGAACLAAFGIAQHLAAPGTVYGIPAAEGAVPFATFFNRNHYAGLAEVTLPMALYLCFADERRRWWWAAAAGLVFGSVLLAGSRAGTTLVTAEVAFLTLRLGRGRTRAALLAAAACAVMTFLLGGEKVAARFRDPEPWRRRAEVFGSGIRMWQARPWSGFGAGTFEIVYPEYATFDAGRRVDHAHNDWIEWLAEGGIPLGLLLLGLFGWAARGAWRHPWAVGVVAVLLHSLVDFPMQIPAVALSVALVSGPLTVERRFNASSFPQHNAS